MANQEWYRRFQDLLFAAVVFCGVKSKLWTRHTVNYPSEMIGQISQTQRVVSRGHCAMLCEAEEMCYMFEYEDITNMCNVFQGFHGFQQPNGNETFPNGPRTVYKDKKRCARTGYTLVRDGLLCYKVNEKQQTWNDVYLACQNDGGRLLSSGITCKLNIYLRMIQMHLLKMCMDSFNRSETRR